MNNYEHAVKTNIKVWIRRATGEKPSAEKVDGYYKALKNKGLGGSVLGGPLAVALGLRGGIKIDRSIELAQELKGLVRKDITSKELEVMLELIKAREKEKNNPSLANMIIDHVKKGG